MNDALETWSHSAVQGCACSGVPFLSSEQDDLPAYFPHRTGGETNRERSPPAEVHSSGGAESSIHTTNKHHRKTVAINKLGGGGAQINVFGLLMSFLETM